jgi:cyclophilin family peptidyl-prolyl cis-trans isomerase
MLWNALKLWKPCGLRTIRNARSNGRRRPARLELERLEDRAVPANASGTLSGIAFLDTGHTGVFNANDTLLAGVQINLTGTTSVGGSVNLTAATDPSGSFSFQNVLPGTYQLSAGPVAALLGGASIGSISAPSGVNLAAPFSLAGGQTVTQNFGFTGGLDPRFISMRLFTTETSSAFGTPGTGATPVNFRPNNVPTVSNAIADVTVPVNSANTTIDLAANFTDPDITNSQVTLNTPDGPLSLQLFDTQAPQTVANFLDYVQSGAFNNAIFTRLVSGFVLQGGGAALNAAGNDLNPIATLPPVPNEFSAANSNLFGTIAMAQSNNDPNSGTNQFFINLANNSNNLDPKKFTVFGKVAGAASLATLNKLIATTTHNESAADSFSTRLPAVDLQNLPLNNYTGTHFPTDANTSNFLTFGSISIDKHDEFLTYSVVGNTNPGLVTTSVSNERLTLSYTTGMVGTATITVQATDRFGATVQSSFNVTVTPKPPMVNSVSIAPDNPTNTTTLTATPSATDPQGFPVTFTYQWLQNGTAISGATSQVLNLTTQVSGGVHVNDKFTVQITPSDTSPSGSTLTGTTFTSNPVIIATIGPITLGFPTVNSVTITPDNPSNVTVLTANPNANDPAGNTITYTFQWLQNGSPIAGATANTLGLTSGLTVQVGDKFTVQVVPHDGVLSGATFTSNPATIATINPITLA